jgi:hypothetical protein
VGSDLLIGTIAKSMLTYLGLLAMVFGFIVCLKGFGDSYMQVGLHPFWQLEFRNSFLALP